MLSTAIKEATKTAHQELEKKVVLRLKTIRNNTDYRDLLKHFYTYFNTIEKAIAPFITTDVLPDYADRRDSSYIKKDIEELGGEINNLPVVQIPEITNATQALGALYVLEGSIMGGPYIIQMLNKFGVDKGVSFFSGYGEATGQKWATFISILNEAAQTEEQQATAIQTANETFARFSDVFGEVEATM